MTETEEHGSSRVKEFLLRAAVLLMFLGSLFLVSYPFISNYLMGLNQEGEVTGYEENVQKADDEEIAAQLEAARAYNRSLSGSVVLTDPFDPALQQGENIEYDQLLNLNGDSVMGVIEIPAIDVELPIYHGTEDEVLQKGAGHMWNTSLPVGGIGTHAVITGHTGLSSAKLFTDLELLEKGDVFLIRVLGEVLAYQVDQIKVVEPSETNDLRIDQEQDYVTLVTCTPYGINSHRLLVRGTRIPYEEAEEVLKKDISREDESTWMDEYKKALIAGIVILVLILAAFILNGRRKKAAEMAGETDAVNKLAGKTDGGKKTSRTDARRRNSRRRARRRRTRARRKDRP